MTVIPGERTPRIKNDSMSHGTKLMHECTRLSTWVWNILIGRPNHDLQYYIGENFCLEQTTENIFNITCSLEYPVTPPPVFQFRIFQNDTLLFDTHALDNFTSSTSNLSMSLSISGTILPSELGITVTCNVSNINGCDMASTEITLCGKFQCNSSIRLSWTRRTNAHCLWCLTMDCQVLIII